MIFLNVSRYFMCFKVSKAQVSHRTNKDQWKGLTKRESDKRHHIAEFNLTGYETQHEGKLMSIGQFNFFPRLRRWCTEGSHTVKTVGVKYRECLLHRLKTRRHRKMTCAPLAGMHL